MININPDKPFKLVVTVTIENQNFELELKPSKRRAVMQASMTGVILDTGIGFSAMDAAHDNTAPGSVHEVIENILPIIADTLRGVRRGQLKPDFAEDRLYDTATGERVRPGKLDS